MRVAHNSHTTDKPIALEFPIKLELRNVDSCGGRKTGEPREKFPWSKDKNQQQTQPSSDTRSRICIWATLVPEVSIITAAPHLLPSFPLFSGLLFLQTL